MPIYESMEAAFRDRDVDKFVGLLHDDFQFVRHQSGKTMNKRDFADMIRGMVSNDATDIRDQRCLYENDEILVTHAVIDFPDGTREAVLEFHNLKDGKIIRTETGATLLSK